jgi:VanZ family protein
LVAKLVARWPWLPRLLFWSAAAFAFVMAVLPHPPQVPGSPSDKVQHVIAFVTLGLLGAWAYPRSGWAPLLAGLSLFGALIELVQAIPALHRDSDVVDWVADTVACAAALALARWWRVRAAGRRAAREASLRPPD